MFIVKSSERISCHFPSGKTASFSLWEDHILFPQGGPHLFPSRKTVSFSLREGCILLSQGGLHPFPSGKTTSFSLMENNILFPQEGLHPFPSGRITCLSFREDAPFPLRDTSFPQLDHWEVLESVAFLVIPKCFHKMVFFHMWFL